MTPEQLVDEVRRRWKPAPGSPVLNVFWVTLVDNRDQFAHELRRARGELPLVPVVLRKPGLFLDPDAVMADVNIVLHEDDVSREIMDIEDCARQCNDIALVVLSRRELRLVVTSSPLQLPEWFPVNAGLQAATRVDDLTWSVHVALSDEVVARNDLQRILYDLDRAMLHRIQEALNADHNKVQALWHRIRRKDENDIGSVLQGITQTLTKVGRNPSDFRPSTSKDPTMVGRLWFEANRNSPDQLPRVAKALADALRAEKLHLDGERTTLMAVLNRPTNSIDNPGVRWSLRLIVTVRSACQLVTAAMHADDYPKFSDVLLRGTSLDLRRFLDETVRTLESR